MRSAILIVAVLLSACSSDPCAVTLDAPAIGSGEATLVVRVVEEDGALSTAPRRMECVDLYVLRRGSYRDTLAAGRFAVGEDRVRLTGLGTGRADVIIDAPGYFPVKFTDVQLGPGMNTLVDKALMFKSTSSMALPGHVGLTLREEARLPDIQNLYGPFGRVRVQAAPGNHYELKIPFRGTKGTRRDVEALLRQLVRSPHVETARPLVTLTAVMRPS